MHPKQVNKVLFRHLPFIRLCVLGVFFLKPIVVLSEVALILSTLKSL